MTFQKELNERADLVAEKDEERIAVEIESGGSKAIENIRKCLDAGFSLVVSVPVNRKIQTQIKEGLGMQELDKTQKVFIIGSGNFELSRIVEG